ncbi:hypothetical protein U1Q18_032892 [Sarracenia purpurea var. burkii]
MEGDGAIATPVAVTITASTAILPPPPDLDFSAVGSPKIAFSHLGEEADEEGPQISNDQQPPLIRTLTDDLRDNIIKQCACWRAVEYYFSNENLSADKFLMKCVTKEEEGFVPITVIASFRKIEKLSQDRSLIVAALKESSLLLAILNGKKVRRLHALPVSEVKDSKLCTVLVENLPEDHSIENVQKIFGAAGNIKNICICDPHAAREPRKKVIAEKLLSGKIHALIEYESVKAAEKAVAMLNDKQDRRYDMRVKFLKRVASPSFDK